MVSDKSRHCPACTSFNTSLVRRKYFVTSLWECQSCGLRFRVPKDDASESIDFYQAEYSAGFTTDCPSDDVLALLIAKKFSDSGKDFTGYIDVLRAIGMQNGDSLLDFGASWGYGSWQFRDAGFRVLSSEVSKPRAAFARTKLSCEMVESIDNLHEPVKCLFSAHVIEHLPNPNLIWEVAQKVLTGNGFVVCFCPNGEPARELTLGVGRYDLAWGKVHPMLITPRYIQNICASYGFEARLYSSPYNMSEISNWKASDQITGDELCVVARRI